MGEIRAGGSVDGTLLVLLEGHPEAALCAMGSDGITVTLPDSVPAGDGAIQLAPNQKLIESPMVGTFYRAASPDSAPFVEEGGSVRKGQPLCIIEAMKMMNEIEAPAAGRVVKILCENGQPIQYGQPLLILEVG